MAKPSYRLARDARNTSTVDIEPSKPGTSVTDTTKPVPHSESLVSPDKPGMPKTTISPSPNATSGTKPENTPAHPEEWKRPGYSDTLKT